MARLARLTIAGQVHHVMQRGNNGQPIFLRPHDYACMLDILATEVQRVDVALHAYVLMENHFHLLATPAGPQDLPQLLQAVGRSYVRYFNNASGRTGTLWDGRYRATVLQADLFLLPCMAYMDLNPVRAGLVASASDYPWSSHRHYIGRSVDRRIRPHALYWTLGNTPFAREARYGELVAGAGDAALQKMLTESTRKGWALGDADFLAELQKLTGRRLTRLPVGRRSPPGSTPSQARTDTP